MTEPAIVLPPEGGDAACWLHKVCDECGALNEDESATTCWRCGAAWGTDEPQ